MATFAGTGRAAVREAWPRLPLDDWADTRATLHMWTQIVGKVRLALAPHENHWWGVPLYVTARGLTTSPMPYGTRTVQMDFDFFDHELVIATSTGERVTLPLEPKPVAEFYSDLMGTLDALDLHVAIWTTPVEVEDRTPFEEDYRHRDYDAERAHTFWRALAQADRVLKEFRARFRGKASPVHFFWGSFDHSATRFSGRPAPRHPGVPGVARFVTDEAYSEEVSSAGWWPGDARLPEPAFYSYAYPEPAGYRDWPVEPADAYYHPALGEFVLPQDAVRDAPSADDAVLAFLQSTYEAAAGSARWQRGALALTIRPGSDTLPP